VLKFSTPSSGLESALIKFDDIPGAVMMDVECNNLTELANLVVDEMVKTGQIRPDDQGHVLRTLLSKHK